MNHVQKKMMVVMEMLANLSSKHQEGLKQMKQENLLVARKFLPAARGSKEREEAVNNLERNVIKAPLVTANQTKVVLEKLDTISFGMQQLQSSVLKHRGEIGPNTKEYVRKMVDPLTVVIHGIMNMTRGIAKKVSTKVSCLSKLTGKQKDFFSSFSVPVVLKCQGRVAQVKEGRIHHQFGGKRRIFLRPRHRG